MGSTEITKEKYCMMKLLPETPQLTEQLSMIENENPEWAEHFKQELESLGAPDAKRSRVECSTPQHDNELAVRVRALECDISD